MPLFVRPNAANPCERTRMLSTRIAARGGSIVKRSKKKKEGEKQNEKPADGRASSQATVLYSSGLAACCSERRKQVEVRRYLQYSIAPQAVLDIIYPITLLLRRILYTTDRPPP